MQVSDLLSSVKTVPGLRLIGKLGEGPHGALYLVQNPTTGKQYGLKFISPTITGSMPLDAVVDVIKDAAGVTHPNIATTYDIGMVGGHAYVLREYVTGISLGSSLQNPSFSLTEVLEIATQATRALADLHQRGLAHRDLKPSNIILTEGKVKLVDFGLGSLGTVEYARSGGTEGALTYMAPEQVNKKEIGNPNTDIYSLGKVIRTIGSLEGGQGASSLGSIYTRIRKLIGEPQSPREQRTEDRAAQRVGKVVNSMLAYKANRRPTADIVFNELSNIRNELLSGERESSKTIHVGGDIQTKSVTEHKKPLATRKVNVWLVNAQPPLFVGTDHRFGVNIGRTHEGALTSAVFQEPDWGDRDQLDLVILLEGANASVSPSWRPAVLPKSKNMEPVYFQVTPRDKGPVLLSLSIFLARELALLEKVSVEVTAVEKVTEAVA